MNSNKRTIDGRPSWDDYFAMVASLTSSRSTCKRLHVGCTLVKENRVIAQGYNGYLPGCKHQQVMRTDTKWLLYTQSKCNSDCAKEGLVVVEQPRIYITLV